MDTSPAVAHLRCLRYTQIITRLRSRRLTTTSRPTPTAPNPEPTQLHSPALLTLQPQTLHHYNISTPPSPSQLKYANNLFNTTPPQLLWSAHKFRLFPPSTHPEVCFLGRSNVGKSSLLNALFNRPHAKPAHVSSKPGRTKTMNAFGVGGRREDIRADTEGWKAMGAGGAVVVDMPGYGSGSREEWGVEIQKYFQGRRQLRRTFVLVDAEHGLKRSDLAVLDLLREAGASHQIVLSKVDKILFPRAKAPSPAALSKRILELRERVEEVLQATQPGGGRLGITGADVLCCSAEKEVQALGGGQGKMGIDAVRWAVLSACGMQVDELGNKPQVEMYRTMDAEAN